MLTTTETVETIADVIAARRFFYHDERELHAGLAEALILAGLPVESEVDIGCGRVDLLVERVAIEVKVDGAPSAVRRQLRRYARSDRVDVVMLVTNRHRHRALAGQVNEKPCAVLVVAEPF